MRFAVSRFANEMERVLQTHDDEKGTQGWLDDSTVESLLETLTGEYNELVRAFNDCNEAQVMSEAVDVANLAMMVYDRIRVRSLSADESEDNLAIEAMEIYTHRSGTTPSDAQGS